jgi:hypothetical protein
MRAVAIFLRHSATRQTQLKTGADSKSWVTIKAAMGDILRIDGGTIARFR